MSKNSNTIFIDYNYLYDFCLQLLLAIGIPEKICNQVTASLMQASLRGVDSHGIMRLPTYLRLYKHIEWSEPIIVEDRKATALLDGRNYSGFVCGAEGMKLAIEKAEHYGIGFVGVKNSGHFGTASYYSMMALEKNMIGFAFTNAYKRIPPWGGIESLLGINPWSYAFPTNGDFPIVLDISNTVVSVGKIRMAALKREKIPFGWATDLQGKSTDDPLIALNGLLTPIGDYKGYGITFIMDILCGVLTGSGFADILQPIESKRQRVGHVFGAIDIEAFMPIDSFHQRLNELIAKMKQSGKLEGVTDILVPGEIEYLATKERMKQGVPLPDELFRELNNMAEALSVTPLSCISDCVIRGNKYGSI